MILARVTDITIGVNLLKSIDIGSVLANMVAVFLYLSLLASFQTAAAVTSFEKKCLAFTPERYIDGATRNVLEFVTAGTTLAFPDNDATCNRAKQAVSTDLCRIALSIKTSKTSSIAFEAWLPEDWTGRFLATGNGGIDGCESRHLSRHFVANAVILRRH